MTLEPDTTSVEPRAADAKGEPTVEADVPQVTFRFTKSQFCRVIHVDGAFGGVSPQGGVYMALFNERASMPLTVTYEDNPDGPGMKEVSRIGDPSAQVIREIEADILMSRATAITLRNWLTDKIDQEEKLRLAVAAEEPTDTGA